LRSDKIADFFDTPESVEKDARPSVRQFAIIWIHIGLFLGLFLALKLLFLKTFHLPEFSYNQPYLIIEIFKQISWIEALMLIGGAVIIVATGDYRTLLQPWAQLEYGGRLRYFIMIAAGMLAWAFSTYSYNFFFDQGHWLSRILLVTLVVLIYWRPVFTIPFLALLPAIIGQFDYPLGTGYARPIDTMLINILFAFSAFLILNVFTKRYKTADFLFLVCCIIAVNYWWPGFGKLKLNWITHGHLNWFVFGGYSHGWLAFLKPDQIVAFSKFLAVFDWPMRIATLVLEWGSLFFLWRRVTIKWFIAGWVAFHLAILSISGFFFWKWIVVEIAFFLIFMRKNANLSLPFFKPAYFALSVLLIAGGRPLFQPPGLAWYDTRLNYTYQFEALGESGTSYTLPPVFFSPYRDIFTFGKFAYLVTEPQLVSSYGATSNRKIANALVTANSAAKIFELEASKRKHPVNERKAARFDAFITKFFRNANDDISKQNVINVLQTPPTFLTFSKGNVYRRSERVTKIIVHQVTSLFDDHEYLKIRNRKIRKIEIPSL